MAKHNQHSLGMLCSATPTAARPFAWLAFNATTPERRTATSTTQGVFSIPASSKVHGDWSQTMPFGMLAEAARFIEQLLDEIEQTKQGESP